MSHNDVLSGPKLGRQNLVCLEMEFYNKSSPMWIYHFITDENFWKRIFTHRICYEKISINHQNELNNNKRNLPWNLNLQC